ncbi:dihydrolipoamide acetyltransferase family protein [Vibrio sp. STUT-A11]|uniref:dihydrolipoamide acetyltransferase family protein n=1 Tax=Vibrio sp. STUT-A11 TaxID=2976236 RepID=UPI00222E69BD|nr:dihydrolipoamide acetyltransferase family protein [Vibrio sp. STUT-A11]BDR16445.1 dihydrolipoamide acetyltransferase component of pyruvate dehydrogenase complex [Vibrio sp. STUT-A11]
MGNNQHDGSLIDITMPALGADMRDGTLMEWQIKPGDHVEKGDIIAVIETSKGAIDMESYHTGTISELLIEPDIKLPVGSVMARMESDTPVTPVADIKSSTSSQNATEPLLDTLDEELPPYIAPKTARTSVNEPRPTRDTVTESELSKHISKSSPSESQQRQYASPVARKTAHLSGIELSTLTGSGPYSAVLLRDLPKDGDSPAPPPTDKTTIERPDVSPMRQAISDAMTRSKKEIPHYYLALDIDLTKVQTWLAEQNQQREPEQRLLLPAVILNAIARQLVKFPDLNGFYQDGHFTPSTAVNIGNTISLREGGLVIPGILNADQLSVDQTMDALRDLAERSRRGRLRSSEISQTTITVTSIGERGADSITGVIYPPQVAIIGLGRQRQAPVIRENQIEIGEIMTVTLAADHRVSDGVTGARFLQALAKQLQHPEAL